MGSCSTFICVTVALFAVAHGAPRPGNEAAPADCFDENYDYPGNDFKVKGATTLFTTKTTAQECQDLCAATDECNFFTYSTSNKRCYMKRRKAPKLYELGATSGPKACKKPEAAALVVPAVVATVAPVQVPEYIKVSSNGGAATAWGSTMGVYKLQDEYRNNFPVWKKQGEDQNLFVSSDKTWSIGPDPDSKDAWIYNNKGNTWEGIPVSPLTFTDGWLYGSQGKWLTDNTIRIEAYTEEQAMQAYRQGIQDMFNEVDEDGNGKLSKAILKELMEVDDQEVDNFMVAADTNNDGSLGFDEFFKVMEVTEDAWRSPEDA